MGDQNPNGVAMKIKAMLEKAEPLFTDKCCIYRVPHQIRKINEDAYTPKVVSIGPFHHGDPKLLKMEDQKRLYCRQFIERSKKNLETFVSCVQELEPQVRACYSDDIKLSEEEHVMVILVDCCFILEILLKSHYNQWSSHDVSFRLPQLSTHLKYDLLLIENQVPFFVLEELYNLAFPSTLNSGNPSHPSLLSLTRYIVPPDSIISGDPQLFLSKVGRISHFTDLLRKLLLISSRLFEPSASTCSRGGKLTHIYSATKLNEAVDDWTEVVLRNLLAFEQCHYIDESYLTDYIAVFDFLINTDKDVDLLIKKGIIVNWLGDSNAVAEMFKGLAVNILYPDFNKEYFHICQKLNAFCNRPWNLQWKTKASVAGIAILILTIIQTVCSIIQVLQGSSK